MKQARTQEPPAPTPDVSARLRVVTAFSTHDSAARPAGSQPELCTGQIQAREEQAAEVPAREVQATEEQAREGQAREGQATQITATADSWRVLLQDGAELQARKAAGCLLTPQIGDTVLVLRAAEQGHYVLNVLEKAQPDSSLDFPGSVQLKAPNGSCELQAREVALSGVSGSLRFARLDLLAQSLHSRVDQLVSAVSAASMAAARVTSRIGRLVRCSGFELHRARSVRTEVSGRFSVSSGQTSITAEQDVSVDAGKINLG